MNRLLMTFVFFCFFASCTLYDSSNVYGDLEETMNLGVTKSGETDIIYYYNFQDKIFLNKRKDLISVQFDSIDDKKGFLSTLSEPNLVLWEGSSNYFNEEAESDVLILQSLKGEVSNDMLSSLLKIQGVRNASWVLDYNGHLLSVSDHFAVMLSDESKYSSLEQLSQKYDCIIKKNTSSSSRNVYDIYLNDPAGYRTIDLSCIFYQTGLFKFTAPDFYNLNLFLSQDTYFADQWALNHSGQFGYNNYDINIDQAWTVTEGSSDIVVAVIDDGVELHEDLASNMLPGRDVVRGINNGQPVDGSSHGTAVAGIINAIKDNNIGISGVAPGCKLMPIRLGPTINHVVEAIKWAWQNGADVINCSWGMADNALVTTEINNATSQGRGGKGCVLVFGSGNEGNSVVSYPSRLSNVLSVGAISYNGQRKTQYSVDGISNWGSDYGYQLNVVAPGVYISTTDRYGSLGYNTGANQDYYDMKYTKIFDGTSAAAPFVSGVAALVLSKYPDLTYRQVSRAIELGCTRLNYYTYTSDNEYPAGARNNEVGYGLVNANGALLQASVLNQQNIQSTISGVDFTINNDSSCLVDQISIVLSGTINGNYVTLISCDPGGVYGGESIGYPLYRGEDLQYPQGTVISDVTVELYAATPNYSGNLMIGIGIDNPLPTLYYNFAFGEGDTYTFTLPDITVPNLSRRMLYVNLIDPR